MSHDAPAGITFRSATPGDSAAVAEYHGRCVRATYATQLRRGELAVPDEASTRRQLDGWFQPMSGFDTLVAVADGVPVAHVTSCGHQVVHLFVAPHRQRAGVGRLLLASAEASLTDAGHSVLELHARVENLAAIGFYESQGWTVTDELIRTIEHGIEYEEHVLVKRTSPRPPGPRPVAVI